MPKMCDFTDRGDCAAIGPGCICSDPGYRAAKLAALPRRVLDRLGVPSDMTANDVVDFFSLPDDDDSMHSGDRQSAGKEQK